MKGFIIKCSRWGERICRKGVPGQGHTVLIEATWWRGAYWNCSGQVETVGDGWYWNDGPLRVGDELKLNSRSLMRQLLPWKFCLGHTNNAFVVCTISTVGHRMKRRCACVCCMITSNFVGCWSRKACWMVNKRKI